MNILLDDIPFNESLYPFGALKSMVHIRVGILSIYEKWQFLFPGKVFLSSQYGNSAENNSVKIIPANLLPSFSFLKNLNPQVNQLPSYDDCKILEYPWQIFEYNNWAIRQDYEMITKDRKSNKILHKSINK
jgi:hypothetical protein